MTTSLKTTARRFALTSIAVMGLSACVGIGITVPLGPFGSIGLGLNGNGQLTGNLGVGGHIGAVGVGTGISVPLGTIVMPQAAASVQQTGASQNVPR